VKIFVRLLYSATLPTYRSIRICLCVCVCVCLCARARRNISLQHMLGPHPMGTLFSVSADYILINRCLAEKC
jgi:hypothetical protein